MDVEIELLEGAKMPTYATEGSAGLDLYANIKESCIFMSSNRVVIPTGIKVKIPPGYEAQIRSRSGNSANFGLFVLNSPGTIDSDYRGEVKVILFNTDSKNFIIEPGMKIAQMVISKYERVSLQLVEKVENDTERGSGGFGSTGNK